MYRLDDLFSAYVRAFWRLRISAKARGDILIERVCKQLLNSLHGKFGQRDGTWQYVGRQDEPGLYAGGALISKDRDLDREVRILDGHRYHLNRDRDAELAFVPIAAWCASYARVYMDEMRAIAGNENVFYQATDSLLVNGVGLGNLQVNDLVDTEALGKFKHEDTYRWVDMWAENQWETDHVSKHSGVKSGSDVVADGTFAVEEWEGLSDGICRGRIGSVATRRVLVRPSRTPCRRFADVDGITHPYLIDNWKLSPERQSTMPVRPPYRSRKD